MKSNQRPQEITATVLCRKVSEDPLPKFRFAWQEPGPDYGKPIVKGVKMTRVFNKSKTESFVSAKGAEEWQALMVRHLENVVLPRAKKIAEQNENVRGRATV